MTDTSSFGKPPAMVPSARERIDVVYDKWNGIACEPDIEMLHEEAMEHAYRDGWNAAISTLTLSDHIAAVEASGTVVCVPGGSEPLSNERGSEKIAAIMRLLYGMSLVDAASCLVVALSEVVDQAEDKDAAWEAVLLSIKDGAIRCVARQVAASAA